MGLIKKKHDRPPGSPWAKHRDDQGRFLPVPYSLTLKDRYSRRNVKRLTSYIAPQDHARVQEYCKSLGVSVSDFVATCVLEHCYAADHIPIDRPTK